MANIKTTTYVKRYFNSLANPWGDFDPQTYDIKKLEDVVPDLAKLHDIMRKDDTIGAYETFEIYETEHEGVKMESEPVNFSIKTIFGSVKRYKDIVLLTFENGVEGKVPFTDKYPHVDPEDVHISVDGGGLSFSTAQGDTNIRVIDRATDRQIWPLPKA